MSDRDTALRAFGSAMANQYMEELDRHVTNGTVSRQGISLAGSNTMLEAVLGNSVDRIVNDFLQSEHAAASTQGNYNHPEIGQGYHPADVRRVMDTILTSIKEPVPADEKRPTGLKNARFNSHQHIEFDQDVLLDDLKAFMGAFEGNEAGPMGGWSSDPNDPRYNTAACEFAPAYDHFVNQKYELAAKGYMGILRYLLGSDHPLPGDNNANEYGVESPTYRSLSVQRRFLLALAWLQEAEVIAKNRQYVGTSSHAWILPTSPTLVDLFFSECLLAKAHLFEAIGNSSAFQHTSTLMGRFLLTLPPYNEFAGRNDSAYLLSAVINNTCKNQSMGPFLSQRHPDPRSDQRYQIIDPDLQVRGAWKKEYIEKEEGLPQTYIELSFFIWGGYLYTVRIKKPTRLGVRPGIPELRRISLKQRTEWEHVTTFPAFRGEGFLNDVCIDGNDMYAFSGHPQMDIFDLSINKWRTVKTTWKPNATDRRLGVDPIWPWHKRPASGAVIKILSGRLYVFGGININLTGCNLLMELDLKTLKWRRLSGTPLIAEHDPHVPGPRMCCGSWVSPDEKRLYIFSGICYKARKGLLDDKSGPSAPWMYDDMWSWDTATETWREERMQGNHPSPRSGMGFAFSKKLNAFLVFGGSNNFVRTNVADSEESDLYAGFYADTYMCCFPSPLQSGSSNNSGHWKQIQTVGFPTYRVDCHLIIDPDTEDIYLYGGQVLGDSIPSKTHTEEQRKKRKKHESHLSAQIAKSPAVAEVARKLELEDLCATSYTVKFRDLWKLHVDVPGGGFEAIDMEDELRTATLGPWQRCFECLNVGFWRKCGGSCNGKAFFCSTDCQTKGWKVHKKLNGCRKKCI